jgi:ABC-2 type transport system ATP-binding protein
VKTLLEDAVRLELRASGVKINAELQRDLEALLEKHGGKLESIGHPTTTLEDLFLHIVEESKARPGRRYLPPSERPERGKAEPPGALRGDVPSSKIQASKPT